MFPYFTLENKYNYDLYYLRYIKNYRKLFWDLVELNYEREINFHKYRQTVFSIYNKYYLNQRVFNYDKFIKKSNLDDVENKESMNMYNKNQLKNTKT